MKSNISRVERSVAFGVIHNIFLKKPSEESVVVFGNNKMFEAWPLGYTSSAGACGEVVRSLDNDDLDILVRDYYQLFKGPGMMKSPPYGSIYTDRENLLFGTTSLEFKEFCLSNGLEVEVSTGEPWDHFAVILGCLSYCLCHRPELVDELLSRHLSPWIFRLLHLVETNAKTGFYRGAAALAQQMLQYEYSLRKTVVEDRQLFF